jgi:hypothetical protein
MPVSWRAERQNKSIVPRPAGFAPIRIMPPWRSSPLARAKSRPDRALALGGEGERLETRL